MARNLAGETALHLVAGLPDAPFLGDGTDSDKKAALLIDAGADIQTKTASGQTPLDYAAESGREAVTRVLQQRGAKG
jgi:ankyrin repeat protein